MDTNINLRRVNEPIRHGLTSLCLSNWLRFWCLLLSLLPFELGLTVKCNYSVVTRWLTRVAILFIRTFPGKRLNSASISLKSVSKATSDCSVKKWRASGIVKNKWEDTMRGNTIAVKRRAATCPSCEQVAQ